MIFLSIFLSKKDILSIYTKKIKYVSVFFWFNNVGYRNNFKDLLNQ